MNMIIILLINTALSMCLILIALWLPQINAYTEKASPYECGFDPMSSARLPFSMKFFLVGITFLLFDLEIALLLPLPWAVQYSNTHSVLFTSFALVTILTLGLIYEWLNKGLEWAE